jgi:thiamine pyrophosphokinase
MDSHRRGLLVIGGAAPPAELLRACAREADLVVAADSGLDHARAAGITPDLAVGDMDSLSDPALLGALPPDRVIVFPADKDETDTEIGVRILAERGCGAVTVAGGGGGRVDHLLGVFMLFEREPAPVRWITDRADIRLVEAEASFPTRRGDTVSVFPLGERAADLGSEGLHWPLDGLTLRRGWAGISNRATGDRVRVTVGRGRLAVVHLFEAGEG